MRSVNETRAPTQSNQSAEKLLVLLETMSTLDEPIRLQDLAKKLRMNASTVLRFLVPLQDRGYIDQDQETNRYFLTFKLCGLANDITSRLDIRYIARPYLRQVAHIFEESANLSIENDMAVLYIESVAGPTKTIMAMQRIGHFAPMHCTGAGKIMLTEYSPQKLDHYIAVKGIHKFTAQTITSKKELIKELESARRLGYAFDNEECEKGARCVAVPVRDYSGKMTACVSVSGPVSRMTDVHIQTNLPKLMDAAAHISYRLGWKKK